MISRSAELSWFSIVRVLLMIFRKEQFLGTIKSPKVKYLETHLFKKNSAHLFEDPIYKNKLGRLFSQVENHQFRCHFCFAWKNIFILFLNFSTVLNICFKNLFRKTEKKDDFARLNKSFEPYKLFKAVQMSAQIKIYL